MKKVPRISLDSERHHFRYMLPEFDVNNTSPNQQNPPSARNALPQSENSSYVMFSPHMVTGTELTVYPRDGENKYFSGTYATNASQSVIMEREEEKISTVHETQVNLGITSDYIQSDEETQPCGDGDFDKVEWCKNKEPAVFPSAQNINSMNSTHNKN